MKTIHKHAVPLKASFTRKLPLGAKFLSCQLQYGEPQMWFEVDPDAPLMIERFWLVGTGQEVPLAELEYLATFQLREGDLVLHLFRS